MSDSPILSVKPIINYPRQVQVGETYWMTIDLQPDKGYEWKVKEEEYPVYCTVDSDIFTSKVVGEPIILMHRFGGSYGAARFLMTALPKVGQGEIKVCLINAWGVTVKVLKVDRIQLVTTDLIHSAAPNRSLPSPQVSIPKPNTKETNIIDFAIITAIKIERIAVLKAFEIDEAKDRVREGSHTYWRKRLSLNDGKFYEIVVAQCSDMANLNAAILTNDVLHHWKPNAVIMVGIAATAKPSTEQNLGDLVVGREIYYYEMGKVTPGGKLPEPKQIPVDATLLDRVQALSDSGFSVIVERPDGTTQQPKIEIGVIASGDKVIADEAERDNIAATNRKILAIEMEGYGVIASTWQSFEQFRCLVIRGLCDYADSSKNDKWYAYAAAVAAGFTKHFLLDEPLAPRNIAGEQGLGDDSGSKVDLKTVQSEKVPSVSSPNFFACDDAWVGRDNLIQDLSDRIRGNCRLLMLVGMTGIGKTALGERIAVEIVDWFENDWSHYHQENFNNDQQASDFASVAARWLEKWGEIVTPEDRKDPQRLLNRLIEHLCENRYLIQMDALEYILWGYEEGWSDFKDIWWLKFFDSYLKVDSCESRFILTSQDLPEAIQEIGMQSQNFWYCQPLSGLRQPEQVALFAKTGLDVVSPNRNYLERIGNAYEGHPLALRVIAGEIKNKPFNGNVQAYWNKYGSEVEEVEKAIAEAQTGISVGADDRWQLDRFTKTLKINVRSRLNKTFARLQEDAKWAYILLCESSVYRCPVPEDFWLSHLEDWDRSEEEQRIALDTLRERYLVEELLEENKCLLRQHNLIRSVALECLREFDSDGTGSFGNRAYNLDNVDHQIIQVLNAKFEEIKLTKIETSQVNSRTKLGHYRAIANWLTAYEPSPTSPNIVKIRGYLESFKHLCELEDWENANRIFLIQLDTFNDCNLLEQLGIWGYYDEQVSMCDRLIGKLNHESNFKLLHCLGTVAVIYGEYNKAIKYFEEASRNTDLADENYRKELVFNNLGNIYYNLGDYNHAVDCFSQALVISDESQNLSNKGRVLHNLGNVHRSLGNYSYAINVCEQSLSIARQLQDRMSEGLSLGNLGLIYNSMGEYDRSIQYCQQALSISQKLAYRNGEMIALDNLGLAYFSLGQYLKATQCHQHQLIIANEIGDIKGKATALLHLGSCSIETAQYSEARENLNLAFEIFNSIGDRLNQANTLKSLAELYQRLGEIDSAENSIDLGLTIALELGIPLAEELQALKISIGSTSPIEWQEIKFEVVTVEFHEDYPPLELFNFEVATLVFHPQEVIVTSPMTLERVFNIAAEAIESHRGEDLTALEQEIIEGTWEKRSYKEIADIERLSTGYVSKIGAALFKCLSEELEKSISKANMVEVFSKFILSKKAELKIQKLPGRAYQFVESLSDSRSEQLSDRVILEMVQIPAGEFVMGAPKEELESKDSERPQHSVNVPEFYLGKYPITQEQWRFGASLPKIDYELNPDPSYYKGNNSPVETVSWFEATEFCARLSHYTKREYRLPSESEWEYACRAETTTPFHFGETITTDLANYNGKDPYGRGDKGAESENTTTVNKFPPNAFGLHDLHGNIWEWCQDHDLGDYKKAPTDGSAWLIDTAVRNAHRIARGGNFHFSAHQCRSASRYGLYSDYHDFTTGFRIACSADSTR
jgi:formylglycine-generating enzyme required for sulfatase activity/nucleoside phosphorylase/tetratricopeptide (TPR) repeat protein